MKAFIIIIIVLLATSKPVAALEYEITADSDTDVYNYEDYLPQYVQDILNENGGYDTNDNLNGIMDALLVYFKEAVDKHWGMFISLICVIAVISVIKRIIDNDMLLVISDGVSVVTMSLIIIDILSVICELCSDTLGSLSEMLTVLLPAFTGISIMGGGTLSSVTGSASFAAVLALLEVFLSGVVQGMVVLLAVLSVFERVSPVLADFDTAKTVKKYTVMLLTFITTIMLTVLSYQGIISARADSLSTRSVKFAAANFIPIIGNAVGESLKTVSGGISYLRASIGGASSLAMFFCVFPTLCEIAVIKIMLSLAAFFSGITGCKSEDGYITSAIQIIDIIASVIICSAILSFLLIYLFSVTAFG